MKNNRGKQTKPLNEGADHFTSLRSHSSVAKNKNGIGEFSWLAKVTAFSKNFKCRPNSGLALALDLYFKRKSLNLKEINNTVYKSVLF